MFEKEYLHIWSSGDKDYEAYKLYIKYEYECELFDRSICSVFDEDGFAVPVSQEQHKSMYSNSMSKLDYIESEKKRLNIGQKEWLNARKDANRHNFEGLRAEYERLFKSEVIT